jgi:predicted GH43/DUF377 family glycosyl hydrolase
VELFRRNEKNPILTAEDLPMESLGVYNPGVAEVNGEVVLLLRVENTDGRSSLHVARSPDGVGDWSVDPDPLLAPGGEDPSEELGCEDPRITYVEERGVGDRVRGGELQRTCVALARARLDDLVEYARACPVGM